MRAVTHPKVPPKSPYRDSWGYSRAVRIGSRIEVSGTSATQPDGSVASPGDAYGQTRYVLDVIGAALRELGADLDDVVRTRVFVTSADLWPEVGRAHHEVFGASAPASTCVAGIALMRPELLVEVEAVAIVAGEAA